MLDMGDWEGHWAWGTGHCAAHWEGHCILVVGYWALERALVTGHRALVAGHGALGRALVPAAEYPRDPRPSGILGQGWGAWTPGCPHSSSLLGFQWGCWDPTAQVLGWGGREVGQEGEVGKGAGPVPPSEGELPGGPSDCKGSQWVPLWVGVHGACRGPSRSQCVQGSQGIPVGPDSSQQAPACARSPVGPSLFNGSQ